MGILASLLNPPTPKNFTLRDPPDWFRDLIGGAKTSSGTSVNPVSAWNVSGVYACIKVISESVSSLPLSVFKKLPRGKQALPKHPLQRLLHDEPNPEMTSMVFRETLQNNLLSWGDAYAEIQRNGIARPIALWPLLSSRTAPFRHEDGTIKYKTREDNGRERILEARNVLHIPGMGFNGIKGQSTIHLARETVGLSLATEEFGATFFGNGANPSGVLEHPEVIGDKGVTQLRKDWNDVHQGSDNAHNIAILEEGMKFHSITIPPNDAQFLETRRFQLDEIARWFNVPPHKIGILDKATFSNITEQSIAYVVDTIRPWLIRWEQEINRKLFFASERDLYVKHNDSALMRGDPKTRGEYFKSRFMLGSLSPNDIRELEDENPIDDGDKYYVPLNMRSLDEPVPERSQSTTAEPLPDNKINKFVENAAKMAATKEHKALRSLVKKHTDSDKLNNSLDDFFNKHTLYVADLMHLSKEKAEEYIESGKDLIKTKNMDNWINKRTDELVRLANA